MLFIVVISISAAQNVQIKKRQTCTPNWRNILHFLFIIPFHFSAVADIMSELIHEKEKAATEAGTAPSPPITGLESESESELVNASGHVQEVDRK